MAMFDDTFSRSLNYFPDLKIKYKDQSVVMKILSKILFFNKDFMNYDTTIGDTIYLPSNNFVKNHPVSSVMVLLHELVHMYDEKKYSKILFMSSYLIPQLFAVLIIPFIFIIGLKFSLLFLLFLLPIPAYFRSFFEKRAYTISYYVCYRLNVLNNFKIDLVNQKNFYISQFKYANYYFMWPFTSINNHFDFISNEIDAGGKPFCDPELYDIVDKILVG